MSPPVNKVVTIIVAASTFIGIVTGVIAWISDKNKVLNFFNETFKVGWLFWIFLSLIAAVLIGFCLSRKKELRDIGLVPAPKSDPARLGIKRYNNRLQIYRFASISLVVICFIILLWLQYKPEALGIYGGSFGGDNLFIEQIHGKVRKGGQEAGFCHHVDPAMIFLTDVKKQTKQFHRKYVQGILYSGQYDNVRKDSVINLEVKWMGGPFNCSIKKDYLGEFTKCTADVNADATLISNFILGFANMHVCNTEKAMEYFNLVYKDIDGTTNAYIRRRMQALRDSLDLYTRKMKDLRQVSDRSEPQDDALTFGVSDSGSQQSQSPESTSNITPSPGGITGSDSLLLIPQIKAQDDTIPDYFSTMSVDSASTLIREIDASGNFTLRQPGTGSAGIKFNQYPLYVYMLGRDYYAVYRPDTTDSYYSFTNLRTMKEEQHGIYPHLPSQIERYLLANSKVTFRFSRPARIQYLSDDIPLRNEGKYSGVTVTIWSKNSKSLSYLINSCKINSAQEGTISLGLSGFGFLTRYPCHILSTYDRKIVLIQKGDEGVQYEEYPGTSFGLDRNKVRKFNTDSIQRYIEDKYKEYDYIELQKPPVFRMEKYPAR